MSLRLTIRALPLLSLLFVYQAANAEEQVAANKEHHLHTAMHQVKRELPADAEVPKLALELYADATDGFNLIIKVQDFVMESPVEMIDADATQVRGHAHLYLNGQKLTRVYSSDLHLPARIFQAGINSLQLSLNDHNHAVWSVDNNPIQATILMNPSLEKFQLSHYSSSPIQTR